MATFDMDAARATRVEAAGGAIDHKITFGGKDFTLPFELPWQAAKVYADPDAFALGLLGDGQYAEFMAAGPSDQDMLVFADTVAEFYGFESSSGEPKPAKKASTKKRARPAT